MLAICLLLCYTPPHVCCIHEGDASDLLMFPSCKGILLDSRLIPFTKYIWWKTPEEALRYPERLIAQRSRHPAHAAQPQPLSRFNAHVVQLIILLL